MLCNFPWQLFCFPFKARSNPFPLPYGNTAKHIKKRSCSMAVIRGHTIPDLSMPWQSHPSALYLLLVLPMSNGVIWLPVQITGFIGLFRQLPAWRTVPMQLQLQSKAKAMKEEKSEKNAMQLSSYICVLLLWRRLAPNESAFISNSNDEI